MALPRRPSSPIHGYQNIRYFPSAINWQRFGAVQPPDRKLLGSRPFFTFCQDYRRFHISGLTGRAIASKSPQRFATRCRRERTSSLAPSS